MFFDSIFVVNLVRRPDRWKSITSQLSSQKLLGVDSSSSLLVKKVPAYDGTLFTTSAVEKSHLVSPVGLDRYKNLAQDQKVWGMDLSAGGIGCALSHVDIWCSVVERNLQRALVLEDDTVLSENFVENAKKVFDFVPADWESVFLSGLDPEGQCGFLRVKQVGTEERYICRLPRLYRTTNCYVINSRGAKNYLKSCVPFTFQLDTAMTTMLVDPDPSVMKGEPVDFSLEDKTKKSSDQNQTMMRSEFVSRIASYCVDPPLAAQATRFGTDIQWKNPDGEHDLEDEEKSRFKAAGI